MVHAAQVLEQLSRDLEILSRTLSPSVAGNLRSILGDSSEWNTNSESLSEIAHFAELIEERRDALSLGQLTSANALWRAVKLIDRLRARFLPIPFFSERPCSIRHHAPDRFPREKWLFVNGIATDKELLILNGQYLAKLFRRPIELIYNPTEGPFNDLLECILGRTFNFVSAPAEYALERVSLALSDPEKDRVVLMGHSQGGIIVSNVVAGLIERYSGDKNRLGKLEVYTFASAADNVPSDPELDNPDRHVPYVEHFANTGDMVAQIGVLERALPIKGKVYTLDKPGHFLNAHYLSEIDAGNLYAWRDAAGHEHRNARLYEYLGGGTPKLLPIHSAPKPEKAAQEELRAVESQVVVGL